MLQARTLRGQPEVEMVAEGEVEFRRGGLVIRADRMAYDVPEDRAQAKGGVRIEREGLVYRGPELQLHVQRFEGYFLEPTFEFLMFGAGGRADRIDFLGPGRSRAVNASYTSCPREDGVEPAWVLKADRVHLDLDANEGIAEGAVLRFLGAPIVALPTLSFPLSEARKSGWLPPTLNLDNRSGLELSVPYYWNIAPNRDATLAPRVITRRGLGLDAEFRYLEPRHAGELRVDALPDDRVAETARGSVRWQHESGLPFGVTARADLARVSDENWWKDFPNRGLSIAPRLLPSRLAFERPWAWAGGSGLAYARLMQWQVLQGSDDAVVAPYERMPQAGLRLGGRRGEWVWGLESEYNRFDLPGGELARAGRSGGERVHALASLAYGEREAGLWMVPRLSLNAAAYDSEASGRAHRTIPTFSVDAGLELERRTTSFGRSFRQTLEPRLLYANTPTRSQSHLPNYDAAAKDFNFASIYSENAFSGVDRVSDAHQITAGMTTRLVDEATGGEALRLGVVQRYLFRPQQVTAQPDGTPDGVPTDQRFSDVLLLGSTNVLPSWTFDAAVQYSAEIQRSVRSILGMRYSPGRFRTVAGTYRFARGLSEQVELGWQWPILERPITRVPLSGTSTCSGSWYGVGRVNYSLKDSRITDSVLGLEYDAGCWIGRIVAERLSTGRSEATTRLLLQLELVGLSRIGSNPLRVLKDNIPGYQLLREERLSPVAAPE